MFPNNVRTMQSACNVPTSKLCLYVLVDLKQNSPKPLRLRGDLFQGRGSQTAYFPRKHATLVKVLAVANPKLKKVYP